MKFSGQIKISNNALQIQRVSAIIPVKPFCHKTLKSLPGSLAGAGKMTALPCLVTWAVEGTEINPSLPPHMLVPWRVQ